MLKLVEDADQKKDLQNRLHERLTRELRPLGQKRVGFPGGNVLTDLFVHDASHVWYGYEQIDDKSIPRAWNAFGIYYEKYPSQLITVETNIPIESNGAQVAGYFARDDESGNVYLMHSGKVAGGLKNVGKTHFLAWLGTRPEPVQTHSGPTRHGLVVANLNDPMAINEIIAFVGHVRDFKEHVRSKDYAPSAIQAAVDLQDTFVDEFSGRKRGQRAALFDYYTYHGKVVGALLHWRQAQKKDGEVIGNRGLVDLRVSRNDIPTEVYEVKTSTDRQALYTAIGQLIVHGDRAAKTLVLPTGAPIASDICSALRRLDVRVITWSIDKNGNCQINS